MWRAAPFWAASFAADLSALVAVSEPSVPTTIRWNMRVLPKWPSGVSHRRPGDVPLQRLDEQGVALTAAAAQRGRAEPTAAALELEQERERHPGAGHADRVAQRDGAPVHVDDVVGDAQVGHRGEADG